ncbi:hypothetical protein F5050DRAFT_1805978 [Lentinula boryana]|uniref:Uncharacterized protein n=1 Tax=Lentinula boryana TaxID=40481 RepID=A0ABQ8QIU2_9AGAR|nr:hypothetical protein F5050DRAFT_1805978 [Lentinula boryana]
MNITEGTVVARELPEVIVAFSPIRDEEFEPYRKKYPAPFSEDDIARNPIHNRLPLSHGRETYEQRSNEPPPQRDGNGGGGGGPPEPSDDGGAGDDNKDDRFSQHPTEEMEPRIAVPDKFNPRSLTGIGETYSYEPKTVLEEECLNEILRSSDQDLRTWESAGDAENRDTTKVTQAEGNARDIWLFRIAADEMIADSNEPSPEEHQNDDEIWDKHEQELPDNKDNHSEPEQWGGSQYESDPIDDDYMNDEHLGLMQDHHSPYSDYYEQLGMMGNYTEYEREDSQSIRSINSLEEIESITESEDIEDEGFIATQEPVKKRAPKSGTRPRQTTAENHCLAAFIEINGVKAFALFDSGSTANAISPDFARVAHLQMF